MSFFTITEPLFRKIVIAKKKTRLKRILRKSFWFIGTMDPMPNSRKKKVRVSEKENLSFRENGSGFRFVCLFVCLIFCLFRTFSGNAPSVRFCSFAARSSFVAAFHRVSTSTLSGVTSLRNLSFNLTHFQVKKKSRFRHQIGLLNDSSAGSTKAEPKALVFKERIRIT